MGKLDAFTPQGLSNTAQAYATVGHYHPALMQQLAEQVCIAAGSASGRGSMRGVCEAELVLMQGLLVCRRVYT